MTKPGKKFLKAADLLAPRDLPYEDVEVPEWGGWVRVRTLTGGERGQYQDVLCTYDAAGNQHISLGAAAVALVILSMIDSETGARLFSFDQIAAASNALPAAGFAKLAPICRKLSKLDEEDAKADEGKSEATPSS